MIVFGDSIFGIGSHSLCWTKKKNVCETVVFRWILQSGYYNIFGWSSRISSVWMWAPIACVCVVGCLCECNNFFFHCSHQYIRNGRSYCRLRSRLCVSVSVCVTFLFIVQFTSYDHYTQTKTNVFRTKAAETPQKGIASERRERQ